jgi:hypothetical protein
MVGFILFVCGGCCCNFSDEMEGSYSFWSNRIKSYSFPLPVGMKETRLSMVAIAI